MAAEAVKYYTNGDVKVKWRPTLCQHAAECVKGYPEVFDPNKRPWINADGADSQQLRDVVGRCPSGALSIVDEVVSAETDPDVSLQVTKNGPLLVQGNFSMKDADGNAVNINNKAAICRCSHSSNQPFCDGSHNKHNWDSPAAAE